MVVKLKQSFEKTRQVKNNDKSKKFVLRGQRIARCHERILANKKNFIISFFLIQHNGILSRLTECIKKHLTSVAKDRILVRHQPLNKITKIQTLGCEYFLLYSLNYLDNIIYFYSFI